MKYSFVKEIREMNLQFYDLKNLLLVLSNMGEKDFKRVYERLKNPNNRDVFVSLVLKLILNKLEWYLPKIKKLIRSNLLFLYG